MTQAAAQKQQVKPQSHRRSMLDQEVDPNTFDTRTHLFDNQGRLVKKNLYTLYVVNGEHFFERPVASGNLWYPNNLPAGRVSWKDGKKVFDHTAPHVTFVPKLDGHEAVEFELFETQEENAALKKELAQVKADFEARLARLEEGKTNVEPSVEPEVQVKQQAAVPRLK